MGNKKTEGGKLKDKYTEAARINKIFLEKVTEFLPQYVFWKDANSVYLGCNENFAQLVGFKSPKEIIGKTDFDLKWQHMGHSAEFFREGDRRVLAGELLTNQEEILALPNGEKLITLVSKLPIIDHDKPLGIVGYFVDITAEKEAERLKLEKLTIEKEAAAEKIRQEAERQEAEVQALHEQIKLLRRQAATIAHELRTPLGALIHGATALELLADKEKNPALQSMLREIQSAIQSETNKAHLFIDIIMENVKDLQNMTTESFSIMDCIHEAIERYPYEEGGKTLISVKDTDDFMVNANKELLIHVLFNLIKNALYFIRAAKKGEVTIFTEVGSKFNKLHFKDTGMGMVSDKTELIFKEFYSDTGVGTGVGLYFCKRVMQAFGGDITCTARKGEYTHFVMTFPRMETKNKNDL